MSPKKKGEALSRWRREGDDLREMFLQAAIQGPDLQHKIVIFLSSETDLDRKPREHSEPHPGPEVLSSHERDAYGDIILRSLIGQATHDLADPLVSDLMLDAVRDFTYQMDLPFPPEMNHPGVRAVQWHVISHAVAWGKFRDLAEEAWRWLTGVPGGHALIAPPVVAHDGMYAFAWLEVAYRLGWDRRTGPLATAHEHMPIRPLGECRPVFRLKHNVFQASAAAVGELLAQAECAAKAVAESVERVAVAPKEPSKEAIAAYRLCFVKDATQTEAAKILSEQFGREVKQPQVSRWVNRVKEYVEAGNVLPDLPAPTRGRRPQVRDTVDPRVIEMGPRMDHLAKRQRKGRKRREDDGWPGPT